MAIPLKVLLVEDHPPDAELMIRELRQAGYDPQWTLVTTEDEFLAALEDGPTVILSDHSLNVFSSSRALALLQQLGLDIPLIVVTGDTREDSVAAHINLGAVDYVPKDKLDRLGKAVTEVISRKTAPSGKL